jgi:molecular chaperone Hsp33
MGQLHRALAPASRIRFTYADVGDAAAELERRHLCGPTAGVVLGRALAAVALMAADAAAEDEAVSLQMKVSGPVEGLLVEATGAGGLRGYTDRKIMNELDGAATVAPAPALGERGLARVMRSTPRALLSSADLQVQPAEIRTVLARYFNQSLQTPTAAELRTVSADGALVSARGLTAERMPDGDHEAFVRVLEAFDRGAVGEALAAEEGPEGLAELFELPDLRFAEERPLAFACRCSRERSARALATLSEEELEEILGEDEPQEIYCHWCGKGYRLGPEEVLQVLMTKRAENGQA